MNVNLLTVILALLLSGCMTQEAMCDSYTKTAALRRATIEQCTKTQGCRISTEYLQEAIWMERRRDEVCNR